MTGLQIDQLSSGYDEKLIVQGCSLSVRPKETTVLMGPSGSGKSTLLLTLLGIVPAISGKIILDGEEISHRSIEQRQIGYMPQEYGLFSHMNVQDNVCFGLRVRGMPRQEQKQIVEKMLQLVHLQGYNTRKISELSGGEKQRVGLARALAVQPKLLLLDEPLSHIDQATKKDVAEHLKELFHSLDIPVILVTHNTEDAAYLAENLAIMIEGKIEQEGSYRQVKAHPKSEFIKRLIYPFSK